MTTRDRSLALCVCALLWAASAHADAPPAPAPAQVVKKPSPTKNRFFVHFNAALNVYTYLDSTAKSPALDLTPADRVITFQQIGFGYWLIPQLRVQLTLQFGETWTGIPSTASRFTLFGIIPWMVYTHRGFFAGLGPLLAPRAGGKNDFDLGLFTSLGYCFQLGRGFSLGAGVQLPMLFLQRFSFAVTPAIVLAYRF